MAQQFKRVYELNLTSPSGKVVTSTELKISFEITKDLFGWPNIAKILLFNLSRARTLEISEQFSLVELKAGYVGNLITIFKGEIKNIINRRESVDTITEIYAGDGEKPIRESNFIKTFAPGISVKQIVTEISDTFGIPKAKLDGLDSSRTNLNGATYSGASKDILDKLSDDYNFYWSVQDGQFVTQARDGADTANKTIVITRSTGMVGSPSVTEIGADVQTLMNPNIQPYRVVEIKSPTAEIAIGNLHLRRQLPTLGAGLFRVNKVIHSGDTRGNNWFSSIVGRRL